jgi:hypothetical protein
VLAISAERAHGDEPPAVASPQALVTERRLCSRLTVFCKGEAMTTSLNFRQEAHEYVQRSEGPLSVAQRARLLEMAESCIRMAEQRERLQTLSIGLP